MATRRRVSCTKKGLGTHHYNHILGIGGVIDGERWYHTEAQAIRNIKNGTYSYYVSVNGVSVNVIIATYDGYEYLKTEPDGYRPNNLINLPHCP